MEINDLYIPLYNLNNVFLDKDTGLPLSNGTVYFWQDSQRLNPKPVYQITGTSPNYSFISLDNPLTLNIAGEFVDTNGNPIVVYGYPFDTGGNPDYYYISVYSEGAVLQEEIELCPYIPAGTLSPSEKENTANELSNPQFVEVNFDEGTTVVYNVTGSATTDVAPTWQIISSGTGTITVSRVEPTSTSSPTNPPYALQIEAQDTLGSFVTLRQTLSNSPRLGSGLYASASCIVALSGVGDETVVINYVRSGGSPTTIELASGTITPDGTFQLVQGNAAIGATYSTDPASTGYITYDIVIPTGRQFQISSMQMVITQNASNIPFDESSAFQQKNNLFAYWQPAINYMPIKSMLVGWDFLLNPSQERGKSLTVDSTPQYIMDQTIGYSINNVTMAASPQGVSFTQTVADNAMYVMQYLDGAQAQKIINTELSVNVNAICTTGTCTIHIYLYRCGAAGIFPTLPTSIISIDSAGVATITEAEWTEVARGGLDAPTTTLETAYTQTYAANASDKGFSGWQVTDAAEFADTDKFAIVVTFATDLDNAVIDLNSISLVPGHIPTRPAPQTQDEVTRECRYYYEKTYEVDTLPGTLIAAGCKIVPATSFFTWYEATLGEFVYFTFIGRVEVEYLVPKRTLPLVSAYSPFTGSKGYIAYGVSQGSNFVATFVGSNPAETTDVSWDTAYASEQRGCWVPSNYTQLMNIHGITSFNYNAYFHYTADARIGII